MRYAISDKNPYMNSIISRNLSLLWLLSFLCALGWFGDYQLETFAVCILTLFVWAYAMFARGLSAGWRFERSAVTVIAGLFWLLVTASIFWSDVKPLSVMAMCVFSALPLTFFAGGMTGTAADFKKAGYALAALFALLSLWAMVQFFFLNTYFLGQARHPMGDPSSLGALFSLALFCSLGWMLADRPRGQHRAAVILSVLLVCGIMATVARGPIFAFVPGIFFFSILLWPRIKACRTSIILVILVGAAFFGLMQSGVQKKYDLGTRLFGATSLQANTASGRLDIWTSTVHMIKDHPWLGTGIGTFGIHYPQYRLPTEGDGVSLAHNDPLQFWAELGIFGPLLFYGFVFAAAMRSFAALKRTKQNPVSQDRIIVVSIFSALVSMVVQSHVSFNHYTLPLLMMTGLLLSVWFVVSARVLETTTKTVMMPNNASPLANGFILALPFLTVAWLLSSILAGEYFHNRARDSLFAGDPSAFMDNVNKAGRVSHGMSYRALLLGVNVPMTILENGKETLKDKPAVQKARYDEVLRMMDDARAINPYEGSIYYYLGKVQTLVSPEIIPEGTPPPEEYYQTALIYNPLHLGARMALYRIYKEDGKTTTELINFMEQGMGYTYVTPAVMEYYAETSQLYLMAGRYEKAKDVMAIAAEFQKRSKYSKQKQSTSIPQALTGGEALLEKQ